MSGAGRKLTIRMPDNPRLRGSEVSRLHVDPGMRVAAGSPVLSLAVRGREHKVRAPRPGRIVPLVAPGDQMTSGDPLYILNIDEEALVTAKRTGRELVAAEKAKWSQGVTPELIEPLIRSKRVGPEPAGWLSEFATIWGKPVLAIALYVLACFALLPLLQTFSHHATWPILAAMCVGSLLFAYLIDQLYTSSAGALSRWAVRLVAFCWLGVSGLAIFGPSEPGEDLNFVDMRSSIASLFAPSDVPVPAGSPEAPSAEETELAEAPPPAAATPTPSVVEPEPEPEPVPVSSEEPAIPDPAPQPEIALASLPLTSSGVASGRPLGPAIPVQSPPQSVLSADQISVVQTHGVAVRSWGRVPPAYGPGTALRTDLPQGAPSVQTTIATFTPASELAALSAEAPVAVSTAFVAPVFEAGIPVTPKRADAAALIPPPTAVAAQIDGASVAAVIPVADPAVELGFVGAEAPGNAPSGATPAPILEVAVLEGTPPVSGPPSELSVLVEAPTGPLPVSETLPRPAESAVPAGLNAIETAGSVWLTQNGLPVPQDELRIAEVATDELPSLGTQSPRVPGTIPPTLLARVLDADPFALKALRPGEADWMVVQAQALEDASALPVASTTDLPNLVGRAAVAELVGPVSAGEAFSPIEIETGTTLAALSVIELRGEATTLSDTAPVPALEAATRPVAAVAPAILRVAVLEGAVPSIPMPEPAFAEKLLLFLYFDDPRAESHPGVGDDWAPQLSPELASGVRAARVEAVREVVQVSQWCGAGENKAWLNDRIRLLQVRLAVEPAMVAALEAELPIFGDSPPGFFHNLRPLLGGGSDAPVMARAWAYLQANSGDRASYFDKADSLASALTEAGCLEAGWDGDGPANAIGRQLVAKLAP